jgi:zinc transport system ATP-binding protein
MSSAAVAATPVVCVTDLSVTYGTDHVVLENVNLSIASGEFVAIAGPNGGGKTTLLRTMLGLVRPASGQIKLFGMPLTMFRERERIGYLRQRSEVGVDAPVTVREVVAAGRLPRSRRVGPLRRTDHEAIDAALDRVGLAGRGSEQMRHLSGGQQQRVFLAKMLAGEPTLLMLDEPTTGVDVASQEQFGELLCELNASLGLTILYVSHEFGAVEQHVHRLILISGGVQFDGAPHDLPGTWHDPSHTHGPHTHGGSS